MSSLRIRSANTLLRADDPQQAAQLRARVDEVAKTTLPEAISVLLPGLLVELGLSEDSELVVRELSVRLVLDGGSPAAEELAAGWAQAILAAVARVAALAPGGGADEQVALYPDRVAAEAAWLVALGSRDASGWWWPALLAEDGRLPGPSRIVEGWLRDAPHRLAAELVDVVQRLGPAPAAALWPAGHARGLTEAWLRTRGLRRLELAVEAPRGPVAAGGSARATPPVDSGEGAGASPLSRAAPSMEPLEHARTLLQSLDPDLRSQLLALPVGGGFELLAAALLLARRPGLRLDGAVLAALPGALAEWREGVPEAHAEPPDPEGARGEPDPKPADAPEPVASESVSVLGGGLLFLIRAAARTPLVQERGGSALQLALAALATEALERVFAPLPPGPRRRRLVSEQPLVEVFSGLSELPERFEEHHRALGTETLDDLIDALPAELEPAPRAFESVYRGLEPPSPGSRSQRLAALLLRPGRLVLTPTTATLTLPSDCVDVTLRAGGWDLDPGWVPWIGRVVRFEYEATPWS